VQEHFYRLPDVYEGGLGVGLEEGQVSPHEDWTRWLVVEREELRTQPLVVGGVGHWRGGMGGLRDEGYIPFLSRVHSHGWGVENESRVRRTFQRDDRPCRM